MPRQPRKIEPGGVYHIINRGVEKRQLFLKPQDYSRFILGLEFFNTKESMDLWNLVVTKGGTVPPLDRINQQRQKKKDSKDSIVELLAFALMPNHFHLIVREIVVGGISLFMRKMGGYSVYFNKQYDRVGPLFQSRYKVVPITTDEQLRVVFSYVHTNPIELFEPGWKEFQVRKPHQALKKLKEYYWSSYRDYIGVPTFALATQRGFLLDFMGGEEKCLEAMKQWIEYKANTAVFDRKILE